MFLFHPPLFWIETLTFGFRWSVVRPDLKSVHSVRSVHAVCTGLPPDGLAGNVRSVNKDISRGAVTVREPIQFALSELLLGHLFCSSVQNVSR